MSEGQRLKVVNPLRQETAVRILLASHNASASLMLASGTAGYTVGILTEGYEALRYPAPFLHSPVKHHFIRQAICIAYRATQTGGIVLARGIILMTAAKHDAAKPLEIEARLLIGRCEGVATKPRDFEAHGGLNSTSHHERDTVTERTATLASEPHLRSWRGPFSVASPIYACHGSQFIPSISYSKAHRQAVS